MRIRQIYYKDEQKDRLLEGAIPYYNPKATKYLENTVLKALYLEKDHKGEDYYGVLSWKFSEKAHCNSMGYIKAMIEDDPAEIYAFNKNVRLGIRTGATKSVWHHATRMWHPYFSEIGNMLMKKIGLDIDVDKLDTPIVYYNYWIATPKLIDDFMTSLFIPCIEAMEDTGDQKLQNLLYLDAKYKNKAETQLSPEGCLEVFGRPYYTYHPFIAERLICTYLGIKNIQPKHLL